MSNSDNHFAPVKYHANQYYRPEMADQVREHLSTGISKNAAAVLLGVTPKTLREWANIHPEFGQACEEGFALGELAWIRLAQNPKHDQFEPRVFQFMMSNVYRVNPPQPTPAILIPGDQPDKVEEVMNNLAARNNAQ